jgi:hypothetical protein
MLRLDSSALWLCGSLALLLGSAGCGDDSSGTGAPAGGGGTATITKEEALAGACDSERADANTTCTGTAEYTSCIETMCADGYTMCLGANYKTGDSTGSPCETYMSCLNTAADKCTCVKDSACLNCLADKLGSCSVSASCTRPQCTMNAAGTGGGTAGTGGGGLTCDQVLACCNQLSGEEQTNCVNQVNQIKAGGDAVCAAAGQVICSAAGG